MSVSCGQGMDGGDGPNAWVVIKIDRSENSREPYRYTCPNGDSSWERLSPSRIWCRCCSETEGATATHDYVLDQKTGELIPFERVEVVE